MDEFTDNPQVPDEPHPHPGPTKCKWCGSPDLAYDERVDETFIYCRDCGATQ